MPSPEQLAAFAAQVVLEPGNAVGRGDVVESGGAQCRAARRCRLAPAHQAPDGDELAGSVIVAVVPPASLSSVREPPWSSAMRRASASPMPALPARVVKNRSKTCARASAGIAAPPFRS